jgi:hypothetical protein
MHFAEVIQMAMHQPLPPLKKYIETGFVQREPAYPALTATVAAGAGLLLGAGLFLVSTSKPPLRKDQ